MIEVMCFNLKCIRVLYSGVQITVTDADEMIIEGEAFGSF
jgi:hypothetical protein